MTDTLKALHDAATAAPWRTHLCGVENATGRPVARWSKAASDHDNDYGDDITLLAADAALIVALRNAYADGSLVARADVDALLLLNAKILIHSLCADMERGLTRKQMVDDLHLPALEWLADYRAALDRIGGAR